MTRRLALDRSALSPSPPPPVYSIRSLSAPMRLSATGEVCGRLCLAQDTTITIGRSKHSCDLTFDDARVSRRHCQLRLLPHSNTLILLDGSVSDSELSCFVQRMGIAAPVVPRLASVEIDVPFGPESHSNQAMSVPGDRFSFPDVRRLRRKAKLLHDRVEKRSRTKISLSKAIRHEPIVEESAPWIPSLNGIFVNGLEVRDRAMVLIPGDEVSLVGPTESGKCLDVDCPVAIGFVVEAQPTATRLLSARSSLSARSITEPAAGVDPLGSNASSNSHGSGSRKWPQQIASKNTCGGQSEPLKSIPSNQVVTNTNERGCSLTKAAASNVQSGGLVSECSAVQARAYGLKRNEACYDFPLNVPVTARNDRSSADGVNQKLLSIINLVNTSVRLRMDLLHQYPVECSNEIEGPKELPIMIHHDQGISSHDHSFTEHTEHTADNVDKLREDPSEKVAGDPVTQKDDSFSFKHTTQIDFALQTPTRPLDNCLAKNNGANNVTQWENDALLSLFDNGEKFVKQTSDVAQVLLINKGNSSSSQDLGGLLRSSFCQASRAMDAFSQTQDIVSCEIRADRSPGTSVQLNLLGGLITSNQTSGHRINGSQTNVYEGVKGELTVNEISDERHSDAESAISTLAEVAAANLTLIQSFGMSQREACLKTNLSDAHYPDKGFTIDRALQEKAFEDHECGLHDNVGSGSAESGCVLAHLTNDISREITELLPQMNTAASDCVIKLECPLGSRCQDKTLESLETEGKQKEELHAVPRPGQPCASAPVKGVEAESQLPFGGPHCAGFEGDLANGEDSESTMQGILGKFNECFTPEMVSKEGNVLANCQPHQGSNLKVNKVKSCDTVNNEDSVELEAVEGFQNLDLCCVQSLPTSINDGENVPVHVPKAETSGYYLNQLEDIPVSSTSDQEYTVCLWDLLNLTGDVKALFIGTFTFDLEWFLSSSSLSRDIPVTVACHDTKRCWSQASKDRCEKPYTEWPNVTLVYPPFPRRNAFGGKDQGIGCHHPKLFLIQRTASLRVIVSSANLTHKQWFRVTNNVWWQDFSSKRVPDFRCLFQGEKALTSSAPVDFASQLAMFLAALLVDAPSEAHWVTDLAAFDFSDAKGSLVASVPGFHQPLYPNAPQFLMSLDKEACHSTPEGDETIAGFLGVVPSIVAGINYRFHPSVDHNGARIRALAATLNDATANKESTMPVLLKRARFLKADPNAVSVIATCRAKGCSQDLFLQQYLNDADIDTMETDIFDTEEGFIKLGFLPRDVAKWLAVLCDKGFFSFAACIWPSEALAVACGQQTGAAKLALYVFEGPKFSTLSPAVMTLKERGAFSGLIKSLHNTWGLWRLAKVLSGYNWSDSCESSFYVSSSSIGTSLDAKFLAAFAAAAGRRAGSVALSQESDPQWGCWTAEQEAADPSISIVFPTIDRVRKDNFLHYGLLCFAESTWLRLKAAQLLHDAIPHPPERQGIPMHTKVALRTFWDPMSSQAYGWMYCGSHNFSPAAWGRPIWRSTDWEPATDAGCVLGSSLHICNYELGVVLMEPPPDDDSFRGEKTSGRIVTDMFRMPFKVPPPKYRDCDRPATGRAMMEAYMEMKALLLKAAEEDIALMQSEGQAEAAGPAMQEETETACDVDKEEARAEQVYVEALWTQVDAEDQRIKELNHEDVTGCVSKSNVEHDSLK